MTSTLLDDVFTFSAFEPLPLEEEVALIARAQDGDDDATLTLLHAYGPALRATVTFLNRLTDEDRAKSVEEARAESVAAFVTVVHDHDPARSPRLAGMAKIKVRASLAELARLDAPLNVPERTLSMFYGILRAAEGDVEAAADLAPSMGMTRPTFEHVRLTVRETVSLDFGWEADEGGEGDYLLAHRLTSDVYRPFDEVEDRLAVETAFAAVEDREARIVELSYGFTEYDPVPDAEIGFRLGYSRPKVQRLRSSALGKMRKALGVALEPNEPIEQKAMVLAA